jgi:hypothetical protein
MCPGVDSASKNEYQDTPRGKDGRCVTVTTLRPSQCRKSRKSRTLTYRIPLGHLGLSRDTTTPKDIFSTHEPRRILQPTQGKAQTQNLTINTRNSIYNAVSPMTPHIGISSGFANRTGRTQKQKELKYDSILQCTHIFQIQWNLYGFYCR